MIWQPCENITTVKFGYNKVRRAVEGTSLKAESNYIKWNKGRWKLKTKNIARSNPFMSTPEQKPIKVEKSRTLYPFPVWFRQILQENSEAGWDTGSPLWTWIIYHSNQWKHYSSPLQKMHANGDCWQGDDDLHVLRFWGCYHDILFGNGLNC